MKDWNPFYSSLFSRSLIYIGILSSNFFTSASRSTTWDAGYGLDEDSVDKALRMADRGTTIKRFYAIDNYTT